MSANVMSTKMIQPNASAAMMWLHILNTALLHVCPPIVSVSAAVPAIQKSQLWRQCAFAPGWSEGDIREKDPDGVAQDGRGPGRRGGEVDGNVGEGEEECPPCGETQEAQAVTERRVGIVVAPVLCQSLAVAGGWSVATRWYGAYPLNLETVVVSFWFKVANAATHQCRT